MKDTFTNREHEKHCELAGCKHPAVYKFGRQTSQGWCALCRSIAFRGVKFGES